MRRFFSGLFLISSIVSITLSSIAGEIKIINFNVWHGIDGIGTFKLDEYETAVIRENRFRFLKAGLKRLNPDIVGIQEANRVPSYPQKLAAAVGCNAVWRITNSGIRLFGVGLPVNFSEGLAVLAKKGYTNEYLGARRLNGGGIQRDYFSIHLSSVRYAMAARVYIENSPVIIFNVHANFALIPDADTGRKVDEKIAKGLLPGEEKGKIMKAIDEEYQQTESDILELLSFVKETTAKHNHPYIIMGDFNNTLESKALRKLIGNLGLIDPYALKNPDEKGYTWDPAINTNTKYDGSPFRADGKTPRKGVIMLEAEFDRTVRRRIDFIFLSKHFSPESIKSARLVFTEPVNGQFVSDHLGVEVVVDGIPK